MELFHAVTQSIGNVLTCDYFDTFKAFKMEGNKTQDKTMDTVPGGETPQYESIKTETVPASKQRGQLGGTYLPFSNAELFPYRILTLLAEGPNTSETATAADQERGQKTAENIRYGQNISESGMGGKTTSQTGEAGPQAGYGGAPDRSDDQKDRRPQQRYGEGTGIGA
ncbi:hypothetical protein G647_08191 [Cladophialophora carrionii CBS 160.54]|uniref:Uncharacterized protein n=1 Tax=Cladophialophora carrionii CBS 160.54 TaxID=1279043 RepID=V9D2E1_9EURO|nr:uncharacterized protein G647_08191 [Cladophialophora carrionii CBS 160.54]ETI20157.1 hypothetical protein G647_08191 [Cladophialophora carrionii CBS 160.54]